MLRETGAVPALGAPMDTGDSNTPAGSASTSLDTRTDPPRPRKSSELDANEKPSSSSEKEDEDSESASESRPGQQRLMSRKEANSESRRQKRQLV